MIPGPKRRTGVGRDAPLAKIYRGPFDNYVGKPGIFFFACVDSSTNPTTEWFSLTLRVINADEL